MTDTTADIQSLRARVAAMRELHVVRWGGIELGPLPPAEDSPEQTRDTSETPEKREQREREERRDVALRASGGLVKRLPSAR